MNEIGFTVGLLCQGYAIRLALRFFLQWIKGYKRLIWIEGGKNEG